MEPRFQALAEAVRRIGHALEGRISRMPGIVVVLTPVASL
jgi:hypothetical protein